MVVFARHADTRAVVLNDGNAEAICVLIRGGRMGMKSLCQTPLIKLPSPTREVNHVGQSSCHFVEKTIVSSHDPQTAAIGDETSAEGCAPSNFMAMQTTINQCCPTARVQCSSP